MFIDELLDWSHGALLESDAAQQYLLGRGMSRDQWVRHRIGYIPSPYEVDPGRDLGHGGDCGDYEKKHLWCDSCRFRAWSSRWVEPEGGGRKVQLAGEKIVGTVVFPLTTYAGNAVGLQTRSITEKAYDTFAVARRPEGYFFGVGPNMHAIWADKEVGLCEGAADQQVIERLVMPNVVALTTAGPSASQMKFLRRFVRRVYLFGDLDGPGRTATKDFIERHGSYFDEVVDVRYRRVKQTDKDPGDVWKSAGDEKFSRLMKAAMR